MHQLLYSKIVQLYQFPYKLGVCKGHRHAKGHRLQFCQFFFGKSTVVKMMLPLSLSFECKFRVHGLLILSVHILLFLHCSLQDA